MYGEYREILLVFDLRFSGEVLSFKNFKKLTKPQNLSDGVHFHSSCNLISCNIAKRTATS